MEKAIKNLYKQYNSLSFPKRYFILSIIASLSGSSYIAFLSEYATYIYAWDMGFRVPAEGVPYLASSIGAISFLIIILSLLVFLLMILIGIGIPKMFKDGHFFDDEDDLPPFTKEMFFNMLFFILLIGAMLGIAIHLIFNDWTFSFKEALLSILYWQMIFAAFITIMYKKSTLIFFSALVALIFAISSPIMLFNTKTYGTLIKELGYGGKLPIVVTLENNSTSLSYLYLRTGSSIFLSEDNKTIIEYPISEIKSIQY